MDPSSRLAAESDEAALVALLEALRDVGYGFTTPTPATHARVNARPENARACDLAGVFGWSRPFRADAIPADILARAEAAGVIVTEADGLRSRIRISELDGLLFTHSAYPTSGADAVFFGPDTYRFCRAIAAWLTPERAARVRRAVDIGTGAGPGGIVVARRAPGAEVVLGDINDGALRLARVNGWAAGLANVRACRSDLLDGTEGFFDLVVSNPPYLNDPLRRAYRHGGGLYGGDLSLRILDAAVARLAPGGTLLLYTGSAIVGGRDLVRDGAAERLLPHSGLVWRYEEIDPDVFGEELDAPAYGEADRIAAVLLTVTREEG